MGRSSNIEKKVRLTLEVGESVKTRLDELRAKTNADSLTEVVRRSLAAYDFLLSRVRKDGTIVLVDDNDNEQPLIILEAART